MRKKLAQNKKQTNKKSLFWLFSVLLLIILPIYLLVQTLIGSWNTKDKFSFVSAEQNGDVIVSVADPGLGELTQIKIPADTEVEVSRGLGTFKIKNVWQLGVNEKIGGDLLCETVVKNFHFPVIYWKKDNETNISLIDKLKLNIYIKKLGHLGKSEIDMGKSQFLRKTKTADGSDGYILSGDISSRLTVYFSDPKIERENIKINIVDATGRGGIAEKLGSVSEVLGGKVVSIERKSVADDVDCEVYGKNNDAVENIVEIFKCKKSPTQSNFDLEIKIGKKFASRF